MIETQIDIERPATEVFDFVSDQRNAPQWQSGLAEVRRMTDDPLGVGTEHVFVRRFAGRRVESRNRFTAFEAGRFVEFEIPDGRVTGTASYRVEPAGGGCRLTSRMAFDFPGWARLLERLLGRLIGRESRKDEARLKALLESPG